MSSPSQSSASQSSATRDSTMRHDGNTSGEPAGATLLLLGGHGSTEAARATVERSVRAHVGLVGSLRVVSWGGPEAVGGGGGSSSSGGDAWQQTREFRHRLLRTGRWSWRICGRRVEGAAAR